MTAGDIIRKINKRKKICAAVHYEYDDFQIPNYSITHKWIIRITNDPNDFLSPFEQKYQDRGESVSIRLFSVEEGIKICKGLCEYYKCSYPERYINVDLPYVTNTRAVYLAIFIISPLGEPQTDLYQCPVNAVNGIVKYWMDI